MSYQAPDLKAPRYRLPTKGTLNQKTLQQLKQRVPQVAHLGDDVLKELLLSLNESYWLAVLQNRDGLELPALTGHLFLAACPGRKADSVDYKSSRELGLRVKHRNWKSDGFLAKIFLTLANPRYVFKFSDLWGFKGCRNFKRAVGQVFPRQWQLYVCIKPDQKTRLIYTNRQDKISAQQQSQQQLGSYDEFQL